MRRSALARGDGVAEHHLRAKLRDGRAIMGTVDSWLIWHLSEGVNGRHVTDVTNASRTMLMDLKSLDWDDELPGAMGVPRAALPKIPASIDAQAFGRTTADWPFGAGIPIAVARRAQMAAGDGWETQIGNDRLLA